MHAQFTKLGAPFKHIIYTKLENENIHFKFLDHCHYKFINRHQDVTFHVIELNQQHKQFQF